jgi:hypothetical protein
VPVSSGAVRRMIRRFPNDGQLTLKRKIVAQVSPGLTNARQDKPPRAIFCLVRKSNNLT